LAVDEQYRLLESGVNEELLRLLWTQDVELERPRLVVAVPDRISAELKAECLAASGAIRQRRQLELDRPAILRAGGVRLRILPLVGDEHLLICPFSLDVDRLHTTGAIVLPSKKNPVPVVVDSDADSHVQTACWALALLGFAALTAPEPARAETQRRTASPRRRASANVASVPRERRLPRTPRRFSQTLEPIGGYDYAAAFVAGHRRRLYEGRQATPAAIARAAAIGIQLRADETWVRPFQRGAPKDAEIEFNWQCPPALQRVLRGL
jgi:hypothetical protein